MHDVKGIVSRLKKITKTKTNVELAKNLNVKESTIRSWVVRDSIPLEKCMDIGDKYKISIEWILKGGGETPEPSKFTRKDLRKILGKKDEEETILPEHISLPFYEISASAGNGTLVENEELVQNISFRADWLRKDLGVNPNDVFIMLTKGDSMDPTIKENALIMVDKNTQKHTNGIYVLRFNGELLVKRLQFTMSNTIKVISDNKAYDTEEINPEQLTGTDLEIIGRVVWSGQRM